MNALTTMWLDIALVVLLVTSITFGFHQGLVRQMVLLISCISAPYCQPSTTPV